MSAETNFLVTVTLVVMGLFFTTYLIYGRAKRKSFLIGGYKPGSPGYDIFLKLVDNYKVLALAIISTLIFALDLTFQIFTVLDSRSYGLLISGPVLVLLLFVLILAILPKILGKKR
jgi:hypothetical protein